MIDIGVIRQRAAHEQKYILYVSEAHADAVVVDSESLDALGADTRCEYDSWLVGVMGAAGGVACRRDSHRIERILDKLADKCIVTFIDAVNEHSENRADIGFESQALIQRRVESAHFDPDRVDWLELFREVRSYD